LSPTLARFTVQRQQEDGMISVIATIEVQADKARAFEKIFLETAARVKANEPGCLLYQLTRCRNEPNLYKGIELYRDQAALDHHQTTDYFIAALPQMGACVAAEPTVEFLDVVD
jgi:quinol monooxygenase YgiN